MFKRIAILILLSTAAQADSFSSSLDRALSNNEAGYLKLNSDNSVTVEAVVSSGPASVIATEITTITTNTTLTTSNQTVLCDATSGAVTITLPSAASAYSSGNGSVFDVKKIDSTVNACNVVVSGGALIDGSATSSITLQYAARSYQSNGTQYWHK